MDIEDLVRRYAEQYTGAIADALDRRGLRNQVVDGAIQGLTLQDRMAGLAFTCKGAPATELEGDDWDLRKQFLDEIPAHSIAVVDTSGDTSAAHWGELMATAARGRGCRGAVIDGGTRDVPKLLEMGFPTFSRHRSPAASILRWRISGFGHPVTLGGVLVRPGDMIAGDADGVVVVPAEVMVEVLEAVESLAGTEDAMRQELLAGVPMSVAYDKYQVG